MFTGSIKIAGLKKSRDCVTGTSRLLTLVATRFSVSAKSHCQWFFGVRSRCGSRAAKTSSPPPLLSAWCETTSRTRSRETTKTLCWTPNDTCYVTCKVGTVLFCHSSLSVRTCFFKPSLSKATDILDSCLSFMQFSRSAVLKWMVLQDFVTIWDIYTWVTKNCKTLALWN